MPTSSIFTTVRVTDPERIEAFFTAMDEATNSPMYTEIEPTHSLVTDPKKLKKMLAKRFPEEFDEADDSDEATRPVEDKATKVNFEELVERRVHEKVMENRIHTATNIINLCYRNGELTLEQIAKATRVDIEIVRELARVEKQAEEK